MRAMTATYSGRFMRPSSLRQETPISAMSCNSPARELSFKLKGYLFFARWSTP